MTEERLRQAAIAAMARAHVPYSAFPVGAAILADDGNIYSGANMEVISFPEGWCAETSAIAHMVMAGGGGIREIAVLAEKVELCTPCGGCRQRIAEFATPDTKVHLCNRERVVKTVRLGDLLPMSFAAELAR